ncbi:MAG TPA: M1 family metallopeptidase [Bacteroidia bacterium]|nr:M1 family metallopeptidase [Bacteroidia bacterium]
MNSPCKVFLILVFLSVAFSNKNLFSQSNNVLHPPDTYRNQDNTYYWKNRPPYPGYWQQDVYYNIKAKVDEATNIIDANLELTYWNNSPDTLTFVYFHLYQNAFQPGSYLNNLTKNNGVKPKWGKYESQKLGTVIGNLMVEDGAKSYETKTELDNTILKVYLKDPLIPGSQVKFLIRFKTYFDTGSERRRMKVFNVNGFKHYDGVHWYPRICVYDKKFGWDTNQHLGREFYGDYGTYDAELIFPNHYIVEATGYLQNRNEVLPDSLREKLDVKNFANKPFNSPPSVIVVPDGTTKTWKYHAENVHDFAWTADPTYRIAEASWNGIQCIGLAQESHAAGWQNSAKYAAKIIKLYSEDIGMYAYTKIVVADARDGMEYPMLTLDGGYDPNYRGLFAHEIGHNWFFAMVGNNETYRALLDEGFSQFLTTWSMDKLEPSGKPKTFANKYKERFSEQTIERYNNNYYSYLNAAIKNEDGFINTHSDMFSGALGHGGGYSMVYRKTGTMLYNLQYVLGDSLFLRAMQHYFNQWKMCHPYPEDFRQSIIDFTKVDLNWFFDQWLETDKHIDYKVCSVKKTEQQDIYKIKFKRKDRMQMPVDFSVYSTTGMKYDFHIPNTWFVKQTDATVLPKWFGWDKIQPTYTAEVKIPGGIDNVVIDSTHRLADINMLDNSKNFPVTLKFDSRISNLPDWLNYEMKVRPDIWYNSYDGFKTGMHLEGQYMNYKHIFSFDTYVNTGIVQGNFERPVQQTEFDPFSFQLKYRTPVINKFFKNLFINLSAKAIDGLNEYKGGFDYYSYSKRTRLFCFFKSMYRKNTTDLDYLLYPDEWLSAQYNNTLTIGTEKNYKINSISGLMNLSLVSSSIGSDYNYSKIILSNVNKTSFSKFDLSVRIFAQYGTGDNTAHESSVFLAGANPEELMEDKFTRSQGFVPDDWLGYSTKTNHFQQGGGLNLRGYAGYVVAEEINNEVRLIYKGSTGAAINLELDFEKFLDIKPKFTKSWLKFDTYLFADAGMINENIPQENLKFGALRADAGIGTALTIKKFGPLEMVNPFTIRFDMPLILNRPPFEEKDYFKFRYVVGVSRSF